MHVLLAPDKFKGSLTAPQAAEAMRIGLSQAHPDWTITTRPVADGGEGTASLLTQATQGTERTCQVADPLGRPIQATYGLSGDGRTAFIELAEASGLHRLTPAERNPLHTSTFGTGQLIHDALSTGVAELVLCIGGSATNDGGIGLAAALGIQFLDQANQLIAPVGGNLSRIARIDTTQALPALNRVRIRVACDVTNPLYGPTGAAYVYAAQKGADEPMQHQLDAGLRHLAALLDQPGAVSLAAQPGSGAAGGVGFGARVFLNAQLESGFALVAQVTQLAEAVRQVDLVLTGEGKLDEQTLQGKVIRGITRLAQAHNKPVVAFCGQLALTDGQCRELGLQQVVPITPANVPVGQAYAQAPTLLREAVARTFSD